MSLPLALDHVVITVGTQLDAAEAAFTRLGFSLTPRGYHTLGSINHLAIFDETYLELLGAPEGEAPARAALWAAPDGLTGLALRTKDASALSAALTAQGAEAGPAQDFSRPVTLSNGEVVQAAFRTFQYGETAIDNGRIFFCEHKTPQHVYREEDRGHPNGVTGLKEIVVQAENPGAFAALIAPIHAAGEALTGPASVALTVLSPKEAEARFGEQTPALLGKRQRQTALRFAVKDRAALAEYFSQREIPFDLLPDGILRLSAAEGLGAVLEFE